jgi:stage III sporulation protein AD
MVDSCFEVISFCMAGAVMAVLLKQYCKEQSMFISLGVCALVAVGFFAMITPVISKITDIFESAGLSENYPELIFKSAAICFITEIACGICRDCGESAIASAAELWGRGAIIVISLPVLEALLEIVTSFL